MEKLISRFFEIQKANTLSVYLEEDGYEVAKRALREMKPEDIESEVKRSNLRGLGGAGFNCGMKWSFVPRNTGKPIYLVVNADEGEPGTFKDKYILEKVPHLLLEGMILAAFAVGIHKAYIYIRGEYELPFLRLQEAVEAAYAKGFLGKNIFGSGFDLEVVIHRGAGAYICGEETGLLESLEGKKGFPRLKPPFPAIVGLFGCPTVINNVETLSYIPFIIKRGSEWFAKLGTERNGGMRLFSVSGQVKKPGVYELPLGISLREIIYTHAGGIRGDLKLKAVVPGGLSAAILKADEIDVKMDFDSLKAAGTMGGSGGVVVMDEAMSMVEALRVTMQFFAHESCGQCSPCREGTGWIDRILNRIINGKGRPQDLDNLLDIGAYLGGTTICALADGAQMAFLSYLRKFRSEFEEFIRKGSYAHA
ncbi:MAG: NADH oxidoreductase (quinone) subunit F [Omnitrophica bacterium RIFCSPHIGHO2_02_FULL_46_11]|nr:MAG: NADH oxidoreductase (quinone) subunit F [Omnitrophica bacterium RIFCSPLOWO2_01_FULL_45_10b]OGW87168.1 MAG: NADH oxidoreductase (quinone) subunit F [Omnitrophica bacterium RIFCSPHIGHO2_02_FULL_46_11]